MIVPHTMHACTRARARHAPRVLPVAAREVAMQSFFSTCTALGATDTMIASTASVVNWWLGRRDVVVRASALLESGRNGC